MRGGKALTVLGVNGDVPLDDRSISHRFFNVSPTLFAGSLDFGLLSTNAKKTLAVGLINSGQLPLGFALEVQPPALAQAITLEASAEVVLPGGRVDVSVRFAPHVAGTVEGSLDVVPSSGKLSVVSAPIVGEVYVPMVRPVLLSVVAGHRLLPC